VWYPHVDPDMHHFVIKEKHKLVKYVLHAKHSKIDKKNDKLNEVIGEEFDDYWEAAREVMQV